MLRDIPNLVGYVLLSYTSNKAAELYTVFVFMGSLHISKVCRQNMAVLVRDEACGHEAD